MRNRGSTRTTTTRGRKIWTPMEPGKALPIMVRFGFRTSPRAGFLIAMETGFGNLPTDGPGWVTSRGAGRLTTTGAGWFMAADGHGGRDRCGAVGFTVRSGRRLMCRSMDGVGALDLALDGAAGVDLAGCRLVQVTGSIRGGAGWLWARRIRPLRGIRAAARFGLLDCGTHQRCARWRSYVGGECGTLRGGPGDCIGRYARATQWRAHDGGESSGGAVANELVGEWTGCGAFNHSRWNAELLWDAEHGADRIVPAADGTTAAIDAAEPRVVGAGRTRDEWVWLRRRRGDGTSGREFGCEWTRE